MSEEKTAPQSAVVIKKYANRRLYNTATSTYVTLDDLATMVKAGTDFIVYDAKTKKLYGLNASGWAPAGLTADYLRGKGITAMKLTPKTGDIVAAAMVSEEQTLVLINTNGQVIRTPVDQIRRIGRATQGVTLISLDEGTKLAGIEKIGEPEDDPNGNGNGSHGEYTADDWGVASGSINYEIVTRIGPRVPRIYSAHVY